MVTQPLKEICEKHKVVVTIPPRRRNHASQRKYGLSLSETGWISALDAAQLLAAHDGDVDPAKSLLVKSLQGGELSCRAFMWCQEADIGDVDWHDIEWSAYTPSPEREGQIDKNILCEPCEGESHVVAPRDIFLKANGWRIAPDDVHWSVGLVVARRTADSLPSHEAAHAEQKIRRFAFGLQFHVDEIGALMRSAVTNGLCENCKDDEATELIIESYLREPNREPWPIWVASVVILALAGRIHTERGGGAKLLRSAEKSFDNLMIDPPSRSRLYPVAAAVIAALKNWEDRSESQK